MITKLKNWGLHDSGFHLFKPQKLSYMLVDFDQNFCLESSILIDILSLYIAFPFKQKYHQFVVDESGQRVAKVNMINLFGI